jgi:acyl-CoA synthetase (AMP-forming)/AMP-acid ligase II
MHLSKAMDLDFEIENSTNTTPSSTLKAMSDSIRFSDNLFYIYTSGTTGLPKAAIIKHSRFILASIMCKHVMGLTENDVLYTAGLPLYHTLGRSISPSNFLKCVLFYILLLRIDISFK